MANILVLLVQGLAMFWRNLKDSLTKSASAHSFYQALGFMNYSGTAAPLFIRNYTIVYYSTPARNHSVHSPVNHAKENGNGRGGQDNGQWHGRGGQVELQLRDTFSSRERLTLGERIMLCE